MGGGLSLSSLSSIGSSLITGVAGGPESGWLSPAGTAELGAGVEILLAELLRGGGPFETLGGESDCELVLELLVAVVLLLLLAMLLLPFEW